MRSSTNNLEHLLHRGLHITEVKLLSCDGVAHMRFICGPGNGRDPGHLCNLEQGLGGRTAFCRDDRPNARVRKEVWGARQCPEGPATDAAQVLRLSASHARVFRGCSLTDTGCHVARNTPTRPHPIRSSHTSDSGQPLGAPRPRAPAPRVWQCRMRC